LARQPSPTMLRHSGYATAKTSAGTLSSLLLKIWNFLAKAVLRSFMRRRTNIFKYLLFSNEVYKKTPNIGVFGLIIDNKVVPLQNNP